MIALVYDADGRFYARQSSMIADATAAAAYLDAEMARKGFTDYVLANSDVEMTESYYDTVSETIEARPVVAARTPGTLPWTIPQSDGETVTVQNEGGYIVESDDYLDPVTITEEGTYRVTVDAGWPSIAWVGDVTLA